MKKVEVTCQWQKERKKVSEERERERERESVCVFVCEREREIQNVLKSNKFQHEIKRGIKNWAPPKNV